jgi:hypothetical protein
MLGTPSRLTDVGVSVHARAVYADAEVGLGSLHSAKNPTFGGVHQAGPRAKLRDTSASCLRRGIQAAGTTGTSARGSSVFEPGSRTSPERFDGLTHGP